MQLILLRINCKIPVIMMGETGCGKTSLITILADLMGARLHTLNIHAGIEDKDIIKFLETIIENEKIFEQNADLNQSNFKFEKKNEKFEKNSLIWIFLDEINTCFSLGLISEILCKRTYLGKSLPDNICFICACNPYRLFTNLNLVEIGLQLNKFGENIKYLFEGLAYKVNPLPFSLLNYVFDFGSLTITDEKKYIESMIGSLKLSSEKIQDSTINNINNLIFFSQQFIRKQNSEISSVSLRDIRRFIIFFRWFRISILTRAEKGDLLYKRYLNYDFKDDLIILSSLLSIFLIYYLRIPDKSNKKIFIKKLCIEMNKYVYPCRTEDSLKKLLIDEQTNVLERVDPPIGIAWNSALLENVFAAFHCINNKVPIYICGKPGCSKSLAIQLIYSSLRGENSKDPYLKTLPRLIVSRYQGSTTSKSSGILNVFKKARNIIKGNLEIGNNNKSLLQEKIISLVYFDEMALAEKSRNNPLKILHSELEPKDEGDKVAFIGISNYKIDASKTNRGIFIARPDLDEEDIKLIAKTIAESYKKPQLNEKQKNENRKSKSSNVNEISRHIKIFDDLAIAYSKYKKKLYEEKRERYDFHGTRDFYYMIKNIAQIITNAESYLKEEEILYIIEESINRNFSGFKNSTTLFKDNLEIKYKIHERNNDLVQINAIQAIKSNLEDYESRYLMIIGESQVSINLLQNLISNLNNNYSKCTNNRFTFLIGSQFENDIELNEKTNDEYNEEYSFKVLSKIQIYMEQGNTLILCGLSCIYPSLYDLFNQNFTIVGGKKYSRIALGTSNNPLAYVHENFKCIIILNEDEVEKQDSPFLNRFEKTIINFESLLKEEYQNIAKVIFNKLKHHLIYESKEKIQIEFDVIKNVINFNINEFLGLVNYYIVFENEYNPERIEQKILEKIVPTFSQDIIALLYNNLFSQKKKEEFDKIRTIYQKNKCNNLQEFIWKKINTKEKQKMFNPEISFVYTYTSIFDEILISQNEIKIEIHSISSFKAEFDLEKSFSNFLKRLNNTFILKFRIEDLKMLNYCKFLCEQTCKNFNLNSNKLFIFIIYPSRVLLQDKNILNQKNNSCENNPNADFYLNLSDNKYNISFLFEGNQIFIDNLNSNIDIDYLHREINDLKYTKSNKFIEIFDNDEFQNHKYYKKSNFSNMNILELINLSFGDILLNRGIFNIKEIFDYALGNSYMKINFVSENYHLVENKNYIDKIINLINKHKSLKEKIITKACEAIPKEENWIKKIMNQKDLLLEKANFIYIIKLYFEKQFKISMTKTIFQIEKNNLLECLLYNEGDIFINKTINTIDSLSISDIKIIDIVGGNIIKRIFGYKLPNSFASFELIFQNFRENLLLVIQKEDELRNYIFENDEEYNIYEEEFLECKKKSVSDFKYLLETNDKLYYIFSNFLNPERQKDLLIDFFDDYLLYYQSKYLSIKLNNDEDVDNYYFEKSITFNEIKDILKFIIKIEFFSKQIEFFSKEIVFSKENISKNIIFLECNSIFIQKYLEIFIIFRKYDCNYLNNIKDIIIKYIDYPNEPTTKYLKIVNHGYYFISSAIIKFTLNKIAILNELEGEKKFELLNEINIVKDNLVELNYSMILKIKQIRQIETIVLVNSFIKKDETNEFTKFYKNLIELLEEEYYIIKDGYNNKINDNLKKFFDLLIYNKIIKAEIYSENHHEFMKRLNQLLIDILILKYKYYSKKNRENIIDFLLSEEDLLINSKNFIQYFFYFNHRSEFDLIPFFNQEAKEGDVEIFGNFAKKENFFIGKIEDRISSKKLDKDKNYLIHSIMLIFEINIQKYFKLINEEDGEPEMVLKGKTDENMNKNYIINKYHSAFLYFVKAYHIWGNMNNQTGIIYPFISKLYIITYIKMFLEKYIEINYKHPDRDFSHINEILKKDNHHSLILKLYIIKILKEKYIISWENFDNFDFIKHQMNWKNSTKELNIQDNEKNMVEILIIDMDNLENYKKIEFQLDISIKNKFKDNPNEFFAYISDENLSLFIDALINKVFIYLKEKKGKEENILLFYTFFA